MLSDWWSLEVEQGRNKVSEQTFEQSSGAKEAGAKLAHSGKRYHARRSYRSR